MSDKPLAYYDTDGAVTIRASGLGKCSRALWAALEEMTPMAPTERLETIFDEGHLHERAVRELLESEGAVMDPQEEITLWIIPDKLKVKGHVDGNITNWEQVWEGKALGKAGFAKFKSVGFDAYPDYPWQISTYMLALDLPALYTVKNRDDGEIIRLVLEQPPIPLADIQAKAIKVYTAHKNGEMPACDPERFMCSFYFLHDEVDDGEEMVFTEDPYIESVAGALAEVREQMKFLADKEDELKDNLKQVLVPGIHVTDTYEVEVKKVTQNRLDKNKLIEAGINVDEYKTPSEYTTVKIKERKK
jgi:hypothetical protein